MILVYFYENYFSDVECSQPTPHTRRYTSDEFNETTSPEPGASFNVSFLVEDSPAGDSNVPGKKQIFVQVTEYRHGDNLNGVLKSVSRSFLLIAITKL